MCKLIYYNSNCATGGIINLMKIKAIKPNIDDNYNEFMSVHINSSLKQTKSKRLKRKQTH